MRYPGEDESTVMMKVVINYFTKRVRDNHY